VNVDDDGKRRRRRRRRRRDGTGGGSRACVGVEWIDAAAAARGFGVRVDVGVAAIRGEKVDARRRVRRRGVGCVLSVVDAGFRGIPGRRRRRRGWDERVDASPEWVWERVAAERDAATDRFWVAHRFGNQDVGRIERRRRGGVVVDEEINPG
jgi:hypothetical protein